MHFHSVFNFRQHNPIRSAYAYTEWFSDIKSNRSLRIDNDGQNTSIIGCLTIEVKTTSIQCTTNITQITGTFYLTFVLIFLWTNVITYYFWISEFQHKLFPFPRKCYCISTSRLSLVNSVSFIVTVQICYTLLYPFITNLDITVTLKPSQQRYFTAIVLRLAICYYIPLYN